MSIPTQEIPVTAVFQGTVLHGTTRGHGPDPERDQTLAGATLVFYAAGGADGGGVARTAWGFRKVPPDSVTTPELGRAVVRDDGGYDAVLRQAADLVLVAIDVQKFSYAPATGKRAFGVLGVAAPQWRESRDGRVAEIDIVLPPVSYCSILTQLDLWLVAGRVADCENPKESLAGGTVSAFDRDLTQDDVLGSAVTDAGGNFSIFFPGSAYKKIPLLPPPFDTIAPFELFGGPDVYFRVTQGASTLLDEPSSQGRTAGRENVGHCSYHQLCVKAPVFTPQTVTLWSHIGNVQVPDGGGLHGFDADGLTASGQNAFAGELDFNGQLSQKYLTEAVSFRFVYAEWPDMVTAPAYPAAYQPLLSGNVDLNAPYGSIYTFIGPDAWNYSLTPVLPAPDGAGWIAVSQDPNFVRDTGRLIAVRSDTLVPPVGAPDMEGTFGAGAPVPAPDQDRHRKFSFVLEVKTASNSAHQAVPVTIHLNNSPAYLHYDLGELASNGCNTVMEGAGKITVHPLYSVAHPYLSSYTIDVQRQGGTYSVVKSDSFGAHSPLWTDPTGEVGTFAADYTDVGNCSYRSSMTVYRRLTNGYGGVGYQSILRTFCVD